MPTVRGVLHRGMTVEELKDFIIAQGLHGLWSLLSGTRFGPTTGRFVVTLTYVADEWKMCSDDPGVRPSVLDTIIV